MPSALTLAVMILVSVLLDAHSTQACLRAGYRETNPFLRRATPAAVGRASAWLAVVLLGVLAAGRYGLAQGLVGAEDYQSLAFVLSAVSITKLLAAAQNYALLRFGGNLSTLLFPRLSRRRNLLADMLITLLTVVLPAIVLTRMLFPGFA